MGVCRTNPHVFCGFGEGIRLCPSRRPVGGALGVWGLLLRAALYDRSRSLVRIACSKSDCSQCMMDFGRAALCHRFCS